MGADDAVDDRKAARGMTDRVRPRRGMEELEMLSLLRGFSKGGP